MIYIDRNSIPVPEIFRSPAFYEAEQRLLDYYKGFRPGQKTLSFQDRFTSILYKEIRNQLYTLFRHRCAYCGSQIYDDDRSVQIDNFRPKRGARGSEEKTGDEYYGWLQLEWQNLYASCPNCNSFKMTWFPVEGPRCFFLTPYEEAVVQERPLLLDPCMDRPEEHLEYTEDGMIKPLSVRGQTTIDILKLNRKELVRKRTETLNVLKLEWNVLADAFIKREKNVEVSSLLLSWQGHFDGWSTREHLGIVRWFILKKNKESPDVVKFLNSASDETDQDMIELVKKKIIDDALIEKNPDLSAYDAAKFRHVYLESLEVKNFRCFKHLKLDFPRYVESDAMNLIQEPWLLFLGENGAGKSTILKAIAIALSGQQYLESMDLEGEDLLRLKAKAGFIELRLVGEPVPIRVDFAKNKLTNSLKLPVSNLAAYNSVRLSPDGKKLISEDNDFKGARIRNLFDYTIPLRDANQWLLGLSNEAFDRAAIVIKKLLLFDENELLLRKNGKVGLNTEDGFLTIAQLSDGYQAVYHLAVDLMYTFAGDQVSFDLAEGIVLIDEIGTHLHPRWRMRIVTSLRDAFPHLQFIVTTHEPLCLRGLKDQETIVLSRNNEGQIRLFDDLPNPAELRVDQLLTSDFFGLKSTIDPETEKLFEEYYELLAIAENDRTAEQRVRLRSLSDRVPKMKHLGNDLRDELIYHIVDETLAQKNKTQNKSSVAILKTESLARFREIWENPDGKDRI